MSKKVTTILLAAVILIFVFAAFFILRMLPKHNPPLQDPRGSYRQAVEAMQRLPQIHMHADTVTTRTVNGITFTQTSSQSVQIKDRGTDFTVIQLDETLTIGSHSVEISKLYKNETVYATVQGSKFSASCDPATFAAMNIPAVPLDDSRYLTVKAVAAGNTVIINFRDPIAPETWVAVEGMTLIDAEGTATIKDGILMDSAYTLTYRLADVQITQNYNVTLVGTEVSIDTLEDPDTYTSIDNIAAPQLLEIASGHLTQTHSISSNYKEYISCEAFGDELTKSTQIDMEKDDSWSIRLETNMTLLNSGRADEPVTAYQSETFIDGQHLVSMNGSVPQPDATVSEDVFKTHCQELLLGTIMLPQYIAKVSYSEMPDSYRITYWGNDAFAQSVSAYACQSLYQNTTVLTESADNSTTESIYCYLDFSKSTGLPLASGVYYHGIYSINDLKYALIYQADQTYQCPSDIASHNIARPLVG